MNTRTLFWGLALGSLVLDQVTKAMARMEFNEHQSIALIPNVLDLTLTFNRGIAFGMFQGMGVLLAPVAILIAAGAALYSHRHPNEHRWTHAAMALLAAGALGNLIDRLMLGKVTDMIWVRFIEFPVFNVADVCITIAGAILVVVWGLEGIRPKPAPVVEPPAEPGETQTPSQQCSEV